VTNLAPWLNQERVGSRVDAIVDSVITLLHPVPVRFAGALRRMLTRPNPERNRRGYTDHLPADVCYLRRSTRGLIAPRGIASKLPGLARKHGVELRWDSRVVCAETPKPLDDEQLGFDLRLYQQTARDRMVRARQGYIVVPPGGGKTVIGCAAMARVGEAALVLVHTTDLADQWEETASRMGMSVRLVGGKGGPVPSSFNPEPGSVTVAMAQAITAAGPRGRSFVGLFGAVVSDECHHESAPTRLRTLDSCPARYRWGVTATPDRADGMGFVLPWQIGPELYRMPVKKLVEGGFLVVPRIVPVETGWIPGQQFYDEDGSLLYAAALRSLCEDPLRTAGLAKVVVAAHRAGRRTLWLSPRVDAAGRWAGILRDHGVPCAAVTGKGAKGQRRLRIRQLREGSLTTLVATKLADEGLDVRALDCLITAPGRASAPTTQRAGRVMRPEGRAPIVFDPVDGGPFRRAWSARARAYRSELGVTPEGSVDYDGAVRLLRGY